MPIIEKNTYDNLFASLQTWFPEKVALKKTLVDEYHSLAIPAKSQEDWKYIDLSSVFEQQYTKQMQPEISHKEISDALKIEQFAAKIVFVNGVFSQSLSKIEAAGISIEQLQDADISLFQQNIQNDKLEMLNAVFAEEGVVIRVAKNADVKLPIVIVFIHSGAETSILNTRNLILCEQFSKTIFESFHLVAKNESVHFNNIATKILVKESAQVEYNQLYVESDKNTTYHAVDIAMETNSSFSSNSFLIDGGTIRNAIRVTHLGEGCTTTLNGLYAPNGTQNFDVFTVVNHKKPNCTTNELYKGIASQKSVGTFVGKIYVAKDAQKTKAYQSNRNILLSPDATIQSKPQLEIWADDVSCTHGSVVGQLNADQLFYCQARGISKQNAVILLLHAFVAEIVDKIKDEHMKQYVFDLIRLKSNF